MWTRIKGWWSYWILKRRDPNMMLAMQWGRDMSLGMGACPTVLLKSEARIKAVEAWERIMQEWRDKTNQSALLWQIPAENLDLMFTELSKATKELRKISKHSPQHSAGTALRLWAGCICGAKVIAWGTRSGPNTKRIRRRQAKRLDSIAHDQVVCAGIQVAPQFKRGRKEPIFFKGVPEHSPLRTYQDMGDDK